MAAKPKYKVIDLFAGIGGMRLGFTQAGFQVVYSNDNDASACKTYRENFGEIDERDIRDVDAAAIPDFDILLGGFPCQPFSMIGKRDGLADPRGQLFNEIVRILDARNPRAFVLENVKNLVKHNKGETYRYIKQAVQNAGTGYMVYEAILDSQNFGVPQHRERTYIVGIKNPHKDFVFPLSAKEPGLKRVKDILEKKVADKYYLSQKYHDGLMAHKARHRAQGSGFGCEILDLNGVSHTVVCGNMGRERNLIQDRAVSINRQGIRKMTEREYARLQGFPDWFKLPIFSTHAYKQFGNAVTVPVANEVARALRKYLHQQDALASYPAASGLDAPRRALTAA